MLGGARGAAECRFLYGHHLYPLTNRPFALYLQRRGVGNPSSICDLLDAGKMSEIRNPLGALRASNFRDRARPTSSFFPQPVGVGNRHHQR
jgi:hypothetical protein